MIQKIRQIGHDYAWSLAGGLLIGYSVVALYYAIPGRAWGVALLDCLTIVLSIVLIRADADGRRARRHREELMRRIEERARWQQQQAHSWVSYRQTNYHGEN